MEALRGHTTGYAVPTFVIDGPGGGGKIPVGPNYIISYKDGVVTLRNYEGKIYTYYEPDKAVEVLEAAVGSKNGNGFHSYPDFLP